MASFRERHEQDVGAAPPPLSRMGSTGMTLAVLEYWRLLLSCLIIVSTNVGFMMIFSDTFGWGAVTYKALSFEFWITRAPLPRTRSALCSPPTITGAAHREPLKGGPLSSS